MDAISPRDSIDHLPRLAFGEGSAATIRDHKLAGQSVATRLPSLEAYEAVGNEGDFGMKSFHLTINGLNLTAQASTPTAMRIGASDDLHFLMPFFGGSETRFGDRNYHWRANDAAILIAPEGAALSLSEKKSILAAKIDASRCQAIIANAPRKRRQLNSAEICRTRLLSLKYERLNFTILLKQLTNLIDQILPDEKAAQILGLDDIFYRYIALIMAPELFIPEDSGANRQLVSTGPALDRICDAVRDRARNPLTLTEMERLSGLSARMLQYAFRKRFGCSPMSWQRRERLYLANSLLTSGDHTIDITSICYRTGFSTPSKFSEHYRRQFGETPGETLRRSRRKIIGHR